MSRIEKTWEFGGWASLFIVVAFAIGYCENVYKLIVNDEGIKMIIVRALGVVFPIIGAIIGWFN